MKKKKEAPVAKKLKEPKESCGASPAVCWATRRCPGAPRQRGKRFIAESQQDGVVGWLLGLRRSKRKAKKDGVTVWRHDIKHKAGAEREEQK